MDNYRETMESYEKLYTCNDTLIINQEQINNHKSEQVGVSIKSPSAFYNELINEFASKEEDRNPTLPWVKTNDLFRFRAGEFSEWAGYSGHKKTMTTYQVAIDLAAQGLTSVMASMELKPSRSLKRMAIQAIGNSHPTISELKRFLRWIEGKIFFYDQQNSVTPEEIIKMARYCSEELKIQNIWIDSLMKCGIAPDDFNGQKKLVNEIVAIGAYNGNHIHLVCHMRKPAANFAYIPDAHDIAGGNDIINQADNIIICWSDKKKENELRKPIDKQDHEIIKYPCQKLIIAKQRDAEFEGRIALWFKKNSLSFVGSENEPSKTYHNLFGELNEQ